MYVASSNQVSAKLPYTYKFSRDVIFEIFAVNWPSAKFSSAKFHLACIRWRAEYLVTLKNKIVIVTSSKFTRLKNLYVYGIILNTFILSQIMVPYGFKF